MDEDYVQSFTNDQPTHSPLSDSSLTVANSSTPQNSSATIGNKTHSVNELIYHKFYQDSLFQSLTPPAVLNPISSSDQKSGSKGTKPVVRSASILITLRSNLILSDSESDTESSRATLEFKPSNPKNKKSNKKCPKSRKTKRTGLVNQASMNGKRKRSATMGSNGEPYSSHSASAANSASITPSTSSQFLKAEPSTSTAMECDYESDEVESSICSSDHDCNEDADDEQSDWPDMANATEVSPSGTKCASARTKYKPFANKGLNLPVTQNPFLTMGLDSHTSSHHGHNSPSVFLNSGYSSKRRRRMHCPSFSQP